MPMKMFLCNLLACASLCFFFFYLKTYQCLSCTSSSSSFCLFLQWFNSDLILNISSFSLYKKTETTQISIFEICHLDFLLFLLVKYFDLIEETHKKNTKRRFIDAFWKLIQYFFFFGVVWLGVYVGLQFMVSLYFFVYLRFYLRSYKAKQNYKQNKNFCMRFLFCGYRKISLTGLVCSAS